MSIDVSDPSSRSSNEALYEFSIYPFSTDPIFQEGLHSIVSSAHERSQEELDNVIGIAKVFYFSRITGHQITWDDYVEWRDSHLSPFPSAPVEAPKEGTSTQSSAEVPSELTFQQLTDLIKAGKTDLIPNNKVIPDALHTEPPSESTMQARKKPWETSDLSSAVLP